MNTEVTLDPDVMSMAMLASMSDRQIRMEIAAVGDDIDDFLARLNRMILRRSTSLLPETDPHQLMLARNLTTVRPLPCERD